jgi:putative MATE family efflux protein
LKENTQAALLLGTEPIAKLLKKYSVPAIIAMTASSLYNMVDSIFIGQGVGAMAISGLALTFPFMNLSAAFGAMVGVGASTLVSMSLGRKDYETARNVLGNVVLLNIVLGILFSIVSLVFLKDILMFFGGSPETIGYAADYMRIILYGNVITHLYLGLNGILRAAGHPKKAMFATIITVLVNVVLDPIFIFVFGWGIQGVAIATILAQCVPLVWLIRTLNNKNELIYFTPKSFKLQFAIVKDILSIGLAPFLLNSALCLIVVLINKGLQTQGGDLAVGAYGIVNRVNYLFVMIVLGLTQGMQPIVGFNFGARQFLRVKEALKITIKLATGVTVFGFLCAQIFPKFMASLFTSDTDLITLTVYGLRCVFITFPVVGFQIVTSNFFQSIGQVKKSIFLSLSRQVLFLVPLLLILPNFYGVTGVWISMPISDIIATFFSATLLIYFFKSIAKLEKNK